MGVLPPAASSRKTTPYRARSLAYLVSLTAILPGVWAGDCNAETITFGSTLQAPATLTTVSNLSYLGTTWSNGDQMFHTTHDGADTALWNATLTPDQDPPLVPTGGQITSVTLEGCAQQPAGAPTPLTQIHFQDLSPIPGGGMHVNVTSQPFDIPVCGGPVTGSTLSTYYPTNMCANAGDSVDFNDEGGFDPVFYPSGVAFQVIAADPGSTMNSFLRNDGTDNGATWQPGDTTIHDGWGVDPGEQLMMQATLATGNGAIAACPGGTSGAPGQIDGKPAVDLPAAFVIAAERAVHIRMYCALQITCLGTLTVVAAGATIAETPVIIPAETMSVDAVAIPTWLVSYAAAHADQVHATVVVALPGSVPSISQAILRLPAKSVAAPAPTSYGPGGTAPTAGASR
jgi:hypothetical protein